jgi:hypothetical protein
MPLRVTPLLVGLVAQLWMTGAAPTLTARWSALALSGLLRSCPQLQCKRKNLQRYARLPDGGRWRARGLEVVSTPRNMLTAIGAVASLTSMLFALVVSVIPR